MLFLLFISTSFPIQLLGQQSEIRYGLASADIIRVGTSAGCNFLKIQQAVDFISSQPLQNAVIINIEPGSYNEKIIIPELQGASTDKNVIIQKAPDMSGDVQVNFEVNSPVSGMPLMGVINIKGTDHLTIKGLTIKTGNTSLDAVVAVYGKSKHIKILNCNLTSPISTDYGRDINLLKMQAEDTEGRNNDSILIQDCIFTGGYIGAKLGGTSYVALSKESGGKIINCLFQNQGSKAIYIQDEANCMISGNTILNTQTTKTGFQGIDAFRLIGESQITRNKLDLTLNQYSTGIELRPSTGTQALPIRVTNNIVNFSNGYNLSYGIILDKACTYTDVVYNTVNIGNSSLTSTTSAAVAILGSASQTPVSLNILNNILINKSGGYSIRVNRSAYLTNITSDHNILFSAGNPIYFIQSTLLTTLSEVNAMGVENNSIINTPEFIGSDDLHLTSNNTWARVAIPYPFITNDFDLEERSATTPYIGADEYFIPVLIAPSFANGYPYVNNIYPLSVEIKIKTSEIDTLFWFITSDLSLQPSALEIIESGNSILTQNNIEQITTHLNLIENTQYHWFGVLKNSNGLLSEPIAQLSFTTPFRESAVSTFEPVTPNASSFIDETSAFEGMTCVIGEGVNQSVQFARVSPHQEGIITLVNTSTGLTVPGLFYRTASTAKLTAYNTSNQVLASWDLPEKETWSYLSTRVVPNVKYFRLRASEETVDIDNFNGEPLTLSIQFPADTLYSQLGSSASIGPIIQGGLEPYTIQWHKGILQGTALPITLQVHNTGYLTATVRDQQGATATARLLIISQPEKVIAHFDDILMNPEYYAFGDSTTDLNNRVVYSGSYQFSSFWYPEWLTWGGVASANLTDGNWDPMNFESSQFKNCIGSGYNQSDNYGIVYALGFPVEVKPMHKEDGDIITGTWITNTAWVKDNLLTGENGLVTPFGFGDWLAVIAKGFNKEGVQTSETTFYLADFRDLDPAKHFIVTNWEWFDLSSLGTVSKVRFTMDGSRKNGGGLLTPTYFAIDDFGGKMIDLPPVSTKEDDTLFLEKNFALFTYDLSGLFTDPDDPDYLIQYHLTPLSPSEPISVELEEKHLELTAIPDRIGETTITIKGISENLSADWHLKIFITDPSPIGIKEPDQRIKLAPNPANEFVSFSNNLNVNLIEVIDITGKTIKSFKPQENRITISELPVGIYILRFISSAGVQSTRLQVIR